MIKYNLFLEKLRNFFNNKKNNYFADQKNIEFSYDSISLPEIMDLIFFLAKHQNGNNKVK